MKKFRCARQSKVWAVMPINLAAHAGWGIEAVGVAVLDQLEVGETTIDDDGDTWERVE